MILNYIQNETPFQHFENMGINNQKAKNLIKSWRLLFDKLELEYKIVILKSKKKELQEQKSEKLKKLSSKNKSKKTLEVIVKQLEDEIRWLEML